MTIPDWWAFFLVGAASWRTFQLVAFDTIADGLRRRALRLGAEWEKDGDPVPDGYRIRSAIFLTCMYCAGFWIAASWWVAFEISPFWAQIAATPFALSAAVVALGKVLSQDEEEEETVTRADLIEIARLLTKKN